MGRGVDITDEGECFVYREFSREEDDEQYPDSYTFIPIKNISYFESEVKATNPGSEHEITFRLVFHMANGGVLEFNVLGQSESSYDKYVTMIRSRLLPELKNEPEPEQDVEPEESESSSTRVEKILFGDLARQLEDVSETLEGITSKVQQRCK